MSSSSYRTTCLLHSTNGRRIDLMHDDVTHPERQYGSCSHAQIQDGPQKC